MRIVIILLVFLSCYSQQEDLPQINVGKMYDYQFDHSELKLTSFDGIIRWVYLNIAYKTEKNDYWKLPEETFNDKSGDCEDITLLIMYLLENLLQIDTKLTLIITPGANHTIFFTDNYYSFTGEVYTGFQTVWECTYQEAIWMTYYYHDSVGKYY